MGHHAEDISMEQITMRELDNSIIEFFGWCEGYIAGAKLGEEPYIFTKVKGQLLNYQNLLNEQNQ